MLRNSVRIIGGKWRSRKIHFPTQLSIKPTPDRVRETLFNWLSPVIEEAYCLDLFAGSGALGFEALSRGATWVGFIEKAYEAAEKLRYQIDQFKVNDRACLYHQSYHRITQEKWMLSIPHNKLINIVFLDPPFRKEKLEASLNWLSQQTFLSANAYCYMEYENELTLSDEIQSLWQPLKQKRTGQLKYGLWVKK